MKTQIPKTKYRAAIKIFYKYKALWNPPTINIELRALGLSDKEIDFFWQSNLETKVFLSMFEDEQRFLHSPEMLREFCDLSSLDDPCLAV